MRILAIQLKRMSELLLTTPALAALKKQLPEAHITLAVDSAAREWLPAFDFIDDSFIFSRKDGNRAFWQKLILSGFDICLDFTQNDRSAICSVLSKSKRRITFESGRKSAIQSIFYNGFVKSSARENHVADHYLHLLQPLEAVSQDSRPRLALPDWAEKKSRQLLDEAGIQGPFILLHPGTMRPEKYWLPERWAEIADFCSHDLALPVVVTGSRDTYEAAHIAAIRKKAGFHDLSGRSDLLSLASLAHRAQLVLSVDSIAMHLGAAFETAQVALFGKTNAFHWRPRHAKAVSVQAGRVGAEPEFIPNYRGAPMSDISTAQAIDAIRSLMNLSAPAR